MKRSIIAKLVVAAAVVGVSAGSIAALPGRPAPRRITVEIDSRFGGFNPRLIRANKGDTIHVTLRALDAAHGFRVAGREDVEITAYPGLPAEVTFVVDWEGGREWFCTFSCGPQHGTMTGMIVANDPAR